MAAIENELSVQLERIRYYRNLNFLMKGNALYMGTIAIGSMSFEKNSVDVNAGRISALIAIGGLAAARHFKNKERAVVEEIRQGSVAETSDNIN